VIDLYTWTTPNGRKVSIMLEEVGLPYRAISIDITSDEQFAAEFLKISPGGLIPAIVDHEENITLMESGAILIYLADKTGKFISRHFKDRAKTIEWLMYQMGNVGPMLGQVHHFVNTFTACSTNGCRSRRILRVTNTQSQISRPGHGSHVSNGSKWISPVFRT
jgi:GST-like protein